MNGILISFPSHRARQYALREIEAASLPKPQACYSFSRGTTGGYYRVTLEQLQVLKESISQHVRFTRLKGPFDDVHECIEWGSK